MRICPASILNASAKLWCKTTKSKQKKLSIIADKHRQLQTIKMDKQKEIKSNYLALSMDLLSAALAASISPFRVLLVSVYSL